MQRLQYFRAQISHALLGGEKGKDIRSLSSQLERAFYAKIVQLFSRLEAHQVFFLSMLLQQQRAFPAEGSHSLRPGSLFFSFVFQSENVTSRYFTFLFCKINRNKLRAGKHLENSSANACINQCFIKPLLHQRGFSIALVFLRKRTFVRLGNEVSHS